MLLETLTGLVLDQKYKIDRQLGKGAMGAVFQATHLGTMRIVALKVIVPQLAAEAEFSQRFKREAEAAGRLRHPNVVNVTDFGVTRGEGTNFAYMVMEYLDGETLTAYLRREPRPSFNFLLDVIDQTALALDAAHAAGIVHRDLKPSNIWLEPNGRGGYNVKVLDFGIAKVSDRSEGTQRPTAGETDDTILMMGATVAMSAPEEPKPAMPSLLASPSHLETTVGTLLGTPAYMAPEQCQASEVDYRADIYSLATIAYEMLCSRLPFQAANLAELIQMHLNQKPESPNQRDASVPVALSEAVMSGLAKDPAARPPSAGTFAFRLRALAEGELAPLRKAKDMAHTHPNCVLPLLLVCMSPVVAILLPVGLTVHMALQWKAANPVLLITSFMAVYLALILFGFQVYKAGCCLMLQYAAANGQFRPMLGPVVSSLVRGMPALLSTQALSLLDWTPKSFRDNLLWPVVWAREGLSGRAAIDRSRQLCRGLPGSTVTGLVVRQFGPPMVGILLQPAIMILALGSLALQFLIRFTLSGSALGIFILLPPLMFTMRYCEYGPAVSFLYWSALLSQGEGHDLTLPASTRDDKRGGFSTGMRRSTLMWAVLPILLLALILVRANRTDHGSALDAAMNDGRRAAVIQALNSGLSADHRAAGKETPLFEAVRTGDAKLVDLLLSRGADVNAHRSDSATPLLEAAAHNRDDMARLLLERGAAVDAADDEGRTALIEAAMRGNLPMARLLLDRGADPKHSDSHGKTALTYAEDEGYQDIAALLRR